MSSFKSLLQSKEWRKLLKNEIEQEYFKNLGEFLKFEYSHHTIYPEFSTIFASLESTTPQNVKVVILGQDPYHGENQANGLAFSVQKSAKIPPSLKNIFKELVEDTGCEMPKSGDLRAWAEQGVLLLNTILTVRKKEPLSHKNRGWERLSDAILTNLSQNYEHIVFILWGANAQIKEKLIDQKKHGVLKAPHPSPLSSYRGFFGSKPFSKTNEYLQKNAISTINWSLT